MSVSALSDGDAAADAAVKTAVMKNRRANNENVGRDQRHLDTPALTSISISVMFKLT